MNRESGDFWLYYRPGAKSWVISKGHYLGKRSFASPDDVIQIPSFDILPTFIQQARDLRTTICVIHLTVKMTVVDGLEIPGKDKLLV